MAQFDVYVNPAAGADGRIPLLLDVQSDLLQSLHTTVVVPLYDSRSFPDLPIHGLMPLFQVGDLSVVMVTPELAGVNRKRLSSPVDNLGRQRDTIIAALDVLFTGV